VRYDTHTHIYIYIHSIYIYMSLGGKGSATTVEATEPSKLGNIEQAAHSCGKSKQPTTASSSLAKGQAYYLTARVQTVHKFQTNLFACPWDF
jgi:hypothetical protein